MKYSNISKTLMGLLVLVGGTAFIWCSLWFMFYGESSSGEIADNYEYMNQFLRRVHNVVELNCELGNIEQINASHEDEETRLGLYNRYNNIKNNLNETPNFVFLIKDIKTHKIIHRNSDLNAEDFLKQGNYVYFSKDQIKLEYGAYSTTYELSNYLGYVDRYDTRYYGEEILAMLSDDQCEIYAAIKDDLAEGDIFFDLTVRNKAAAIYLNWWRVALAIGSVLFAMGLIGMAFVCGRKSGVEVILINAFDRLYSEIQLALFLLAAGAIAAWLSVFMSYNDQMNNVELISLQLVFVAFLATMIGLVFYTSLIRQIKGKILFKYSLFGRLIMAIKSLFMQLDGLKLLRPSWLIFLIAYGLSNLFIGTLYDEASQVFLFIVIQLIFGGLLCRQLKPLKDIIEITKKVSEGHLELELDTERYPSLFKEFYSDIYDVQSGMRHAIDDAVKGERLKTELITNVSHDLKTPLTSIISYVDLLKKESLDNNNAAQYVDVLAKKSDALKRLIDDLIEASKVSSGNVQVECRPIELNELVRQCIGEFQDRFTSRNLDVRVSESQDVMVRADGQSMWRVIENLFENISKYTLPNSRVYLQLYKIENMGCIVFKNISETPLEISPEELMARFVRGSDSRTTEGSGLGLSIAEGLVSLQGGDFKINIDGDLFKVTIQLPLKEEENDSDEIVD